MRIPSWAMKTVAVIVAIPFGWAIGVLLAYLIAGREFGQLPVLTVPVGLVAGIVFALMPVLTTAKRIAIMVISTLTLAALGR
jgi:hypothetical protein